VGKKKTASYFRGWVIVKQGEVSGLPGGSATPAQIGTKPLSFYLMQAICHYQGNHRESLRFSLSIIAGGGVTMSLSEGGRCGASYNPRRKIAGTMVNPNQKRIAIPGY